MTGEGWSELPLDILATIDEKLAFADHARFRSICTAWNAVPRRLHPPLGIPWLLLAPSSSDRGSSGGDEEQRSNDDLWQPKHKQQCCQQLKTRFYSISDDRTYELNVGHLADVMAECRAIVSYSPGGWLMYMNKVCELQCFHLATGERIRPPSITTLPEVGGAKTDCQGRIIGYDISGLADDPFHPCDIIFWYYQRGIIVFPGSPTDSLLATQYNNCKHHSTAGTGREYLILVAYGGQGALALARQGDTSWTLLDFRAGLFQINSLILHKGMIFVVNNIGNRFFRIEFNSDLSFQSSSALSYDIHFLNSGPHADPASSYLVDIDGHLWFILRRIDFLSPGLEDVVDIGEYDVDFSTPRTSFFQVFKLDESQTIWVEMETIGDFAIFVGNNYSLALSTHDCPHLTKDCIYFSDDFTDCYCRPTSWDVGVFNLLDRSVTPLYDRLNSMDLPQPTWIMSFLLCDLFKY